MPAQKLASGSSPAATGTWAQYGDAAFLAAGSRQFQMTCVQAALRATPIKVVVTQHASYETYLPGQVSLLKVYALAGKAHRHG